VGAEEGPLLSGPSLFSEKDQTREFPSGQPIRKKSGVGELTGPLAKII